MEFEVKPFGPDHKYVTPPEDVKCKAVPEHTGLLLPAAGTKGGVTVIMIVSSTICKLHELSVTVRKYVPDGTVILPVVSPVLQ